MKPNYTIKKYLRRIKRKIICDRKTRKNFIDDLKASIVEFAQEIPNLTYADLVRQFGNPDEVSEQFMENINPEEIERAYGQRKRIFILIIALLIVGLSFTLYTIYYYNKHLLGYGEIKTIVYPTEYVTSEEMEALEKLHDSEALYAME